MLCKPRITLILLLHGLSGIVNRAQAVNHTIDDEYGDEVTGVLPLYSPPNAWRQGANCSDCLIRLDARKNFRGTWHDTTMGPNEELPTITVQFNGTAVYVFCTLVQQAFVGGFVTALTSAKFIIDGEVVGEPFLHVPTVASNALYQQQIYSNSTLEAGPHTFTIQVTTGPDNANSLMLFDYIQYTPSSGFPTSSQDTETNPAPAAPSSLSTPTAESRPSSNILNTRIAGGIAGGVGALALGLLVFYLIRRRARPRLRAERDMVDLLGILEPLSPDTNGPQSPSRADRSPVAAKLRALLPLRPSGAKDQLREGHPAQASALETMFRRVLFLEERLQMAEAPPPYEDTRDARGAGAAV